MGQGFRHRAGVQTGRYVNLKTVFQGLCSEVSQVTDQLDNKFPKRQFLRTKLFLHLKSYYSLLFLVCLFFYCFLIVEYDLFFQYVSMSQLLLYS